MESQGLTTDDLRDVLRELADVTPKWYFIGLELGLKDRDLDSLLHQSSDPMVNTREMAKRWLKNSPCPTWAALADALSSPTVKEAQKAKELRQMYCQPPIASGGKLKPTSGDSVRAAHTPASIEDQHVAMMSSTPLDTSLDSLKLSDGLLRQDSGESDSIVKSKPLPETKSGFHYLDTSRLARKDAEQLKGRLLLESRTMVISFQGLVSGTMDSLLERGIAPQDLVSRLMSLRALKPAYDQQPPIPALLHRSEELKNATTIQAVFIILQDYCSFFNYEIIGYIIAELGTEKDKAKLQLYEDELKRYSKRRVFECPLEYGSRADPSQVYVVVKLDKTLESFTLEELQVFKEKLSTIFHLEHPLELLYVEKGCMQMTFQIPSTMERLIFPLSPEQLRELQAEGVIMLSSNNYLFEPRWSELGQLYIDEMQIPDRVPFGKLVGKRKSNLVKLMGSTGCLLTAHDDSRKVEIIAADEVTLAAAKEKLQAVFTQLSCFGPMWCFFHTDGVKETSLLEFRHSVDRSLGPPEYDIYASKDSFSRAVNLEGLEKLNRASPLDSEDTLYSTLDTLHGTGVERQTSYEEAVQTVGSVGNQTRLTVEYREQIQQELQNTLGWFQKHQGQQRAKLEARFGKVTWALPQKIVSEQPLGIEKFLEFVSSDKRSSRKFIPRVGSTERLQKELEAATQGEDTFILHFSLSHSKERDAKFNVHIKSERGELEILEVRKNDEKIIIFDIPCLHRQHDIRLSLSKFEVIHPVHPVFAIVQELLRTVSLKEPETLSLVPYSDEWNVFYVRHKKTTTYTHDRKYIVEIKNTTEMKVDMRETVKGREVPIRLQNNHTEVEVYNEIWEHAFESDIRSAASSGASLWNPQTIVNGLNDFFIMLDNFNRFLEES